MAQTLLKIQNLNLFFGQNSQRKQVVFNFNLEMDRGEVLGIVGESGSGKSVTAMSIMHLIENVEMQCDTMKLFDESGNFIDLLSAQNKTLRSIRGKRVSYIFQEPMTALHPLFSCGKQVVEGIREHENMSQQKAKIKTLALFEEMELPHPEQVFDSYPHQLSGGQRQRVMIAMALSNDPELLVADEPTTALDSVLQKQLTRQMVDGCKSRNAGLMLISHDVQLIKDYSQRLVVMYAGKQIETGLTTDVLNRPASLYTQSLLSCQPTFEKRSTVLPTVKELTSEQDGEFSAREFQSRTWTFQPIERETPFIRVQNISKNFIQKGRQIQAVDDVSFDMYQGETLGLVGESGCGKSTLSKIIINLLKPDHGTVQFLSGRSSSHSFARAVQMIFQDPYSSLNPSMRVGAMMSEVLKVHNIVQGRLGRKQRVTELLYEVGLSAEDAKRFPHEFSGGQRQRISIARALAVEPDLIICDESVSALDVSIQAQILNLFNELKASRKLTYLFISHDLRVVSYMCDRILVMKDGKIIEANETGRLMTSPEESYTKHLLSHM